MFDLSSFLNTQENFNKESTAPFNVMAQPILFENQESEFDVNRTSKQKNNLVSYDIGSVAGSRKELAALKKAYLESKNRAQLAEIALIDDTLADELANKKSVFSWFSMDSCKGRGVDVAAAYGMHLLIRRLPADTKGMYRDDYMNAMEFISDELYRIKTFEQFQHTLNRFGVMALDEQSAEYHNNSIVANTNLLIELEQEPLRNERRIKMVQRRILDAYCYISSTNKRDAIPLHKLESFANLVTKYKSKITIAKSAQKYSSWDDYEKSIQERTEKRAQNTGKKKQSVWERQLPINPIRKSEIQVPSIMIPEDYVSIFKFRANQMGHWMKDSDALGHLRNSASAFVDLAHILDIPVEAVSINGTLAMAFGARGTGRALAHFERGKSRNVINMTKTKGSLGVLAHEWMHSLDFGLRSMIDDNDFNEMLSEANPDILPGDLRFGLQGVLNAMKEGTSTDYFMIDPEKRTSATAESRILFASCDYDVQRFVDTRMELFDQRMNKSLNGYISNDYQEKARKRLEKRRKAELDNVCHIAGYLHKMHTGSEIFAVPYTINMTAFYANAIKLDKGKVKNAYWSTNVEMIARAFEAYIASELEKRGMQNDYLVCGAEGYPYPEGEELVRICDAFTTFFEAARPYLLGETI